MRLLSRIALGGIAVAFALTLDFAEMVRSGELRVGDAWAKGHHRHRHQHQHQHHRKKHHRARHRHKKGTGQQTEM